jgi:hypothetical protein
MQEMQQRQLLMCMLHSSDFCSTTASHQHASQAAPAARLRAALSCKQHLQHPPLLCTISSLSQQHCYVLASLVLDIKLPFYLPIKQCTTFGFVAYACVHLFVSNLCVSGMLCMSLHQPFTM